MGRAPHRGLPRLPRWRRLALGMAAGVPLLSGCSTAMDQIVALEKPRAVPTAQVKKPKPSGPVNGTGIQRVDYREAEGNLPTPRTLEASKGHAIPITLDAVLHLAQEQNPQIALAREKLAESQTEQEIACKGWLPNVFAGVGYYRHEGGIQDFNGNLIKSSTGALFPGFEVRTELDVREASYARVNSERKQWQAEGEVSKVTNEILLEAGTAYIDLITARRAEAVALELEKKQLSLAQRADDLAKTEQPARAIAESTLAEISRRRQGLAQLRQQGDAAAAKLAYLLGLPPDAELVPMDKTLAPIDIVDATAPTEELVARVLASGPGVRELEGMIGTIQNGLSMYNSPLRFLPTLQANAIEGGFGAGPNSSLYWDNRFDVGIQAKYNLTELCTAREKRRLAESKLRQSQLTYDDLRGKLVASVKESREAIIQGRDQIRHGREQIGHAGEGYRLNDERIKEAVQGATIRDVLDNLGNLERAHFGYLAAVSTYNKAQIRLMLLLGPVGACSK